MIFFRLVEKNAENNSEIRIKNILVKSLHFSPNTKYRIWLRDGELLVRDRKDYDILENCFQTNSVYSFESEEQCKEYVDGCLEVLK